MRRRQLLADDRIVDASEATGEFDRGVEFAFEPHLLSESRDAAFVAEQCHGDLPPVARASDDHVGRGARLGEEGLVELAAAGDLTNGSHLDTGLIHRHEKERETLVALRTGFATRHHETPVAHVGERGPDLLAVDDPLVTLESGLGLHVGEIGSGVRFAVSLAPPFVAAQDAGQETRALLRSAVLDDRGREQVLTHVIGASRCFGAHVFLGPDDLLIDRRAASAEFLRPPESDPSRFAEHLLPLDTNVEPDLFVARAAAPAQGGEFAGHVGAQPVAAEFAELPVVGGQVGSDGGIESSHGGF